MTHSARDIRIEDLLPHRPPMLLIEEIVALDQAQRSIIAGRKIHGDEFFLQGHYPNFPIVPGVITCECIFQAGAALLRALMGNDNDCPSSQQRPLIPVVSRVGKTKFKGMIRPGDYLQIKAHLVDQLGSAFYLKGAAVVENRTMATVEFTCMEAEVPR